MRVLRRLTVVAAAAFLLTACGSHTAAPTGAPAAPTHRATSSISPASPTSTTSSTNAPSSPTTSQATSQPTSNHFVAAAALAACRAEVALVADAEEAADAMDGRYVPLRQLVPVYLHALPAYVGSWDLAAGKPVIGGGTSTKVAPAGCG